MRLWILQDVWFLLDREIRDQLILLTTRQHLDGFNSLIKLKSTQSSTSQTKYDKMVKTNGESQDYNKV